MPGNVIAQSQSKYIFSLLKKLPNYFAQHCTILQSVPPAEYEIQFLCILASIWCCYFFKNLAILVMIERLGSCLQILAHLLYRREITVVPCGLRGRSRVSGRNKDLNLVHRIIVWGEIRWALL